MCTKEEFQVKSEFDDSNFYYQDEEQQNFGQLNESLGELTTIKTPNGDKISVLLRLGNRILFCSGKYFYIEHATVQTDHEKECTGIVSTCHTCGVKIKGSLKVSSNFICHLKTRHPEVYQEFLKQKQESGAGSRVRRSERSYCGLRTSPYPTKPQAQGNILQHQENQEKLQRNILHFLIATNQSLKLVENVNFLNLFEFLDFPVILRTPFQYEQIIKDDCKYKQLMLANYFNNSKVYVCLTSDIWSFGECKYFAFSCHWIDEQYQRQTALLACMRSSIEGEKCLQTIQNEVLMHYGFQKKYIVNIVTKNIQNYQADFMDFGVKSEALCFDYLDNTGDDTLLKQMQEDLKLLHPNNEAANNAIELDVLRLNKIWVIGFSNHLDVKTRHLHRACIEKCFVIWKSSHSARIEQSIETTLNGSLRRPSLFSFTSLYNSLKQLHLNKNKMPDICNLLEQPSFSEIELEYLEELVEVFEPLHAACEFLDMPQNHFYGCFLPTLVTLKWKLIRLHNSKKLKHLQELLIKLKEQLLTEFKLYYELNDSKSEAIIAAITYPPVKTRFLMGLQDSVLCFNFQARNLLLKYAKDYHTDQEEQADANIIHYKQDNTMTTASNFFDFGDSADYIDAEELRDVNISKKELSELVAELYDDLMNEGLCMDSIDLETPRKFLISYQEDRLNTPNTSPPPCLNAPRQLNFEQKTQEFPQQLQEAESEANALKISSDQRISQTQTKCNTIISTNSQHDYTFQPGIMSTPSTHNKQTNNYDDNDCNILNSDSMTLIPIAQTDNTDVDSHNKTIILSPSALNTQLELIAVPIPGQPNCYQLARVVLDNPENKENTTTALTTITTTTKTSATENSETLKNNASSKGLRGKNSACTYISVRREIVAEYIDKFKTLQHAQDNKVSSTTTDSIDATAVVPNTNSGFTQYQYDLMQQQLRIHVQQLTQTVVQTYCHPELWKLAPKAKELLLDLQEKAKDNVNFQAWNLELAIELINNWQKELDQDTPENTELMNFLHHENMLAHHHSRQIPRFHPRILECYLNSPVFMYPQYLPKMPFSAISSFPIFSPVEAYLIAMGLEKHLQLIYEKKEKITLKSTPLRVACKRLAKDTVYGKGYRRIWDHIMHLQKVDYYNPIKYFFEHNRAPPVEQDPIWTFENNVVLPPKDRIPELPFVFQSYLQKKNEPSKPKNIKNKKSRKRSSTQASDAFRRSYLEFVQEAVGEDICVPNLFYDPVESSDTQFSDADSNTAFAEKRKKLFNSKPTNRRIVPQSLTINVNYVYGNGLDISQSPAVVPAPSNTVENSTISLSQNTQIVCAVKDDELSKNLVNTELTTTNLNASSKSLADSAINSTIDLAQNNLDNTTASANCPIITYNFDWKTKSLQPAEHNTSQTELNQSRVCSSITVVNDDSSTAPFVTNKSKKLGTSKKVSKTFQLHKRIKQKATAYREKRRLKRRCEELITTYSLHLHKIISKYKDYPLIQQYYSNFKALELYTYLLKGLKSICSKTSNRMSSPSNLKRTRNNNSHAEDDNSPASARQVRKLNRQEENFRHMLLPDTPQEANRKDAIYAFNFYEKVEEAFKAANKLEDCKKFNAILKSFDPKKDKVSDLYYKLEKLFLPDHPELAQVFLTFLLPSEAAEIGKFFEHFMINNMSTFINKLNIYFNKQPAQIRKIYNCLNDLAEDPNVTMKKVETKILPLLKGNQFLIDWFMQQFPQNTPPERLFYKPEHINLKDQQCNRTGEYIENVTDLIDSPTNDAQQQQSCQLRYINGRIFYGSKMLLPAKLSFMAASYSDKIQLNETSAPTSSNSCVHGIKEHGEKRLQEAAELTSTLLNAVEPPSSDDQDKSEEEDVSKALVIDTTADEEDSSSSMELCDEAGLRAHATRLNPSVYSSTYYSTANASSTPNLINNYQAHHAHAKKTALNFHDEVKLSPRKNSTSSSTSAHQNLVSPLATSISNSPINTKEKRKSPNKKLKSPSNNSGKTLKNSNVAVQPMVVIHEANSAIQCAKRLKSLIDGEVQQNESVEEVIDTKDIIKIVARTKSSLKQTSESSTSAEANKEVKEERSEDLEPLTEQSALSPSPFPCLRIETDSNEEDAPPPTPASDEDCKIDIVSSLTNDPQEISSASKSNDKSPAIIQLNAAWTRDEDKIILIEMKIGSQNRKELYERIAEKLPNRTMFEITSRHQFLMDFLSKLQGK